MHRQCHNLRMARAHFHTWSLSGPSLTMLGPPLRCPARSSLPAASPHFAFPNHWFLVRTKSYNVEDGGKCSRHETMPLVDFRSSLLLSHRTRCTLILYTKKRCMYMLSFSNQFNDAISFHLKFLYQDGILENNLLVAFYFLVYLYRFVHPLKYIIFLKRNQATV